MIVGGSTRAAAWSARRAGFQPICADLFADADTRQIAEIVPVRSYPDSLPDDVANVVADGWFYTGALENRPDLIERLSRPDSPYGPLWGASVDTLRQIRDPFWVAELLRRNQTPALEVLPQSQAPEPDGTWMLKPLASAGGQGVYVWNSQQQQLPISEPAYFQRRVEGLHLSALYSSDGHTVNHLGFTRQRIFDELAGAASPFLYSGSIGPLAAIDPSPETNERVRRGLTDQATVLARESGLSGIFGVDFVLDEQGIPWILEVNPRYTASVELLELAFQRSLLSLPGDDQIASPAPPAETSARLIAKAVLYARAPLIAPDLSAGLSHDNVWAIPEVADIPVPGSAIDATWPICTVMSEGTSLAECLNRLRNRVDTVRKMVNDQGFGEFQ